MRKVSSVINPILSTPILGSILILLATLIIGFYVGDRGVSYREFMILGVLIIVVGVIILGDRGINLGYICWIIMFGLGHRTIRFTSLVLPDSGLLIPQKQDVALHPLLLLIFFLLVLIVLRIVVFNKPLIKNSVPKIVWPFSLFWLWGVLLGIVNGYPLYIIVPIHLLNFVILIPIFIVVNYVLNNPKYWKLSITAFYGVGTYIAMFGIAEFTIPGFASFIPGFEVSKLGTVDILGFHRAYFSFWGHPAAIFVSMMALPFILVLFKWYGSNFIRIVLIISGLCILYGLYIAGWRSTWATIIILFILLAIAKRSWKAIFLVIIMILIIYLILPPEARARFATFTSAVDGDFVPTDTSSIKRFSRAETALQQVLSAPLGLGWSASGWVHSDFIQLSADTGIISGALFAVWYLSTLIRVGLNYWHTRDDLRLGLFGSFFLVGVLFLTQPMYVETQTIAPVWFVWAMVNTSLQQSKGALVSDTSKA